MTEERTNDDRGREPRSRRELRMRAAYAVQMALRRGDLPRLDGSIQCADCERPAEHYDHRSYFRPLDVVGVCRRCNRLRGPAEPKWLPDYTGAIGEPLKDARQIQLSALVESGATMEAIGAALGVTRERARQLIWVRGLRPRWSALRDMRSTSRLRDRAAARVSKYLNGRGGARQRFINEAAGRGLRVEVLDSGHARRIRVEGVPVTVHTAPTKTWRGSDNGLRADHPGYWHCHSTPGSLNVYALQNGNWAFVLQPTNTLQARHVTIYLRPDNLVTEWPSADDWTDFRILFGASGLTVVRGAKDGAA